MNLYYIDTFINVVESGSFSKAAEDLHISSTGVMKQIASIEEELGVQLLLRNFKGVALTESGKVFFSECSRLLDVYNGILKNTRRAASSAISPVVIGFAPINPMDSFIRICQRSSKLMQIPVSIISFATDINTSVPTKRQNTETAEIGFGAEPPELFVGTDFYPFDNYRLTCAIPSDHPLAHKSHLLPSDLKGETILFPARGNRNLSARFAASMKKDFPDITVETPSTFYDLELFNRCAEEKKILISLECSDHIHPGLVNLPVDWDWAMPYGILWKKDARKEVLDFVAAFKEAVEAE